MRSLSNSGCGANRNQAMGTEILKRVSAAAA